MGNRIALVVARVFDSKRGNNAKPVVAQAPALFLFYRGDW
jgi:hypothetical protein